MRFDVWDAFIEVDNRMRVRCYFTYTPAEYAKKRLKWAVNEDRMAAIDPLTEHRIRLMIRESK